MLVALAPVAAVLAQTSGWLLPLLALPVLAVRRSAVLAAARRVQAMRDPLTGLGNRDLFFGRAARRLERSAVTGEPVCVLMLDLDHFKDINDTLGHQIGDLVLQEIGRRIAPVAPEPGCVARLGGDEFAVLLPGVPARGGGVVAEQPARRHRAAAADRRHPVQRAGQHRHRLARGSGAGGHRRRAGSATSRRSCSAPTSRSTTPSASGPGGRCTTTTPRTPAPPSDSACWPTCARRSRSASLSVSFQPQVSLHDGEVSGTEALARWTHPERGVIDPEEFIALAENAGLISQVTDLVLEDSLAALDRWNAAGLASRVSVNLSARQAQRPQPARAGRPGAGPARRAARAGDRRGHREQHDGRPAPGRADPARACAGSGCGWRSTTSAPGTPRWPTCRASTSTRSRSTAPSCGPCRSTATTCWCAPSSSSGTTSG
ncbi:hypothetical protein GCM10025868_07980 [Angustibacter aerolatus]|uniref:GGDEF domain-containing protein n=1 Tax=Angustibacter aerolatus TaxID=1162965 RepID=A0ABQ6JDR0_9ACTN|nr:hypothetical protein GCM10025868_07980 [Angustibacter aerolatus]